MEGICIAKRRKYNQFDLSDKNKDGTAILIYETIKITILI